MHSCLKVCATSRKLPLRWPRELNTQQLRRTHANRQNTSKLRKHLYQFDNPTPRETLPLSFSVFAVCFCIYYTFLDFRALTDSEFYQFVPFPLCFHIDYLAIRKTCTRVFLFKSSSYSLILFFTFNFKKTTW